MEAPLKLNRNGWLAKWVFAQPHTLAQFIFTRRWEIEIPKSVRERGVSLCALFWACVFVVVLHAIGVLLAAVAVAFYVAIILPYKGIRAVGRRVVPVAVRRTVGQRVQKLAGRSADSQIVLAMLRAKRKVCPLIEIE